MTAAAGGAVTAAAGGAAAPPALRRWPDAAVRTAAQVLAWAADPRGPAPRGSLRTRAQLLSDADLRLALRALTRSTAARIGAGEVPFGGSGRIGPGGILLAAAIGGRDQLKDALPLTALVPAPVPGRAAAGWIEALARHAVVGRFAAEATAGDELARACLDASPLSTVLVHPPEGRAERAMTTALALLERPRGERVLVHDLAAPAAAAATLAWRARLLTRLAGDAGNARRGALVASVYTEALLRHFDAWWDEVVRAVDELQASALQGRAEPRATAVVEFWRVPELRQVAGRLVSPAVLDRLERIRQLIRFSGVTGVAPA